MNVSGRPLLAFTAKQPPMSSTDQGRGKRRAGIFATIVTSHAFRDRDIVEIHGSDTPVDVLARFPSRVVFIGGGPPVYAAYARFIRHWDINRLPYDGDADRWFDPAWLVAGGHRGLDRALSDVSATRLPNEAIESGAMSALCRFCCKRRLKAF